MYCPVLYCCIVRLYHCDIFTPNRLLYTFRRHSSSSTGYYSECAMVSFSRQGPHHGRSRVTVCGCIDRFTTVSAGETVTYALRVGSQLFTLTGIGLVTALFKGILAVWGIARKSPTWLKLAVVCFLILVLSSKKGRSWILHAVELIPRELGEARDILSGAFESVFDYWESGQAMKRRSETSLAKYGSWQSSLHPEKAEDFVILVLAASSTALAVGTIARRVIALGYVTRNQRFEYYILRILRSNPVFTGTPDGRWTLGASLAPKPTVQVAGE